MNALDRFLQEDMLITRPSVFVYISKDDKDNVINKGISVKDGKISAYLNRLPESVYGEFLSTHYPVRLTLSKFKKIKDQLIQCIAKNIDGVDKIDYTNDDLLEKIIRKYEYYLKTCYDSHVPMENLPHIDIYVSGGILPGFICKVLDT